MELTVILNEMSSSDEEYSDLDSEFAGFESLERQEDSSSCDEDDDGDWRKYKTNDPDFPKQPHIVVKVSSDHMVRC
jgi:hypothetical protein